MFTALVAAETPTRSGFSFTNLLVLIVLLAIAVPLIRKLRRSASEKRKRRWAKDGLMDPPAAGPETSDRS